jgi:glycosyltransferase involved in cell wall biosynthesis
LCIGATTLTFGATTDEDMTPPTISVVTPSFNRKRYLAEAMQSVLGQGYPGAEYVVVDGGSTDGSVELIAEREDELAWWVSEADGGPWEAINKGFAHTTGDVMCWLGSDDMLMPWSLSVVGELFGTFPEIEWLTTLYQVVLDAEGRAVRCRYQAGYGRPAFMRGENLPGAGWYAKGWIQQESTFWRRGLWERAGGRLDESIRLAADFDLWARFFASGAELYGSEAPLGGFRMHGDQKSATDLPDYIAEARAVLARQGGRPPGAAVSWLRPRLSRAIPQRYHRVRSALGVDTRQKMCVHHGPGEGWRIENR